MGKKVVSSLAFGAAVYLTGAFVCWEFHPGKWDMFARYMVGVVGMAGSFILYATARD